MIEMMMSRTSGDSLGSARTVSLAALHDRVRMPAVVSQPLALPAPAAAFAEEVDSPPPATAPKALTDDTAAASDEAADLFEILQHRKEAAKLEATTTIPKAFDGAVPISKVAGKAPAIAPKAIVKAAAKSKAPVKAIAVAPAKGKALAKAAVPVKAVAGAKVGALLVLGCSKCRYAETGCSQCKDPRFTGARWNLTLGAKAKAAAR